MKKLTYLLFFINRIQKKKIWTALEEKLMQKLEKKNFEEKLKKWIARLARHPDLARRKAHNEVQRRA